MGGLGVVQVKGVVGVWGMGGVKGYGVGGWSRGSGV